MTATKRAIKAYDEAGRLADADDHAPTISGTDPKREGG
jgi:hypothetical protein